MLHVDENILNQIKRINNEFLRLRKLPDKICIPTHRITFFFLWTDEWISTQNSKNEQSFYDFEMKYVKMTVLEPK